MDNSIYIQKLPYKERSNLCRILDHNDKWIQLANSMRYDELTIRDLKSQFDRDRSPSDELLTLWSKHNHTVGELFLLLNRMREVDGMEIIKAFVPENYLRLMRVTQKELERVVAAVRDVKIINNVVPDPKIDTGNFNNREKMENNKKLNGFLSPGVNAESRDGNVSHDDKNGVPRSPVAVGRTSALTEKSDICFSAEALPHISYADLQISTDNWNKKNVLGTGGFGIVFKGTWKCTKVAIKRLKERRSSAPDKQIIAEVNSLNAYRHDNILPLYGLSNDGAHTCLIYQYMSGGSLDHRIHSSPKEGRFLSWQTRLKIAIGSARGIQFLHTTAKEPLIHGDIKCANILLDENGTARIGDFGLARKGPGLGRTHLTITHRQGTEVYLPDDYLRGRQLSTKVDTFSFGIVLYELATALPPYDKNRKAHLRDLIDEHKGDPMELIDKNIPPSEAYFLGLLDIGRLCTKSLPRERPEMVDVLIKLEAICSVTGHE